MKKVEGGRECCGCPRQQSQTDNKFGFKITIFNATQNMEVAHDPYSFWITHPPKQKCDTRGVSFVVEIYRSVCHMATAFLGHCVNSHQCSRSLPSSSGPMMQEPNNGLLPIRSLLWSRTHI